MGKIMLRKDVVIAVLLLLIQACAVQYFRTDYTDANKLLHDRNLILDKPFLKAHLKNGDVCILRDSWQIDTIQNIVSGSGQRYDYNRKKIANGPISIPIDSVAIFETNVKLEGKESGRIIALCIMSAVDIGIGIACIIDPKACFGSCPTFYLNPKDDFHYADAEGFSNAIAPSMEYGDVDALNNRMINGNIFSLTMKNEALETHCVNDVKLMAYPTAPNERVYQSPSNEFYLCENNYVVQDAKATEGDVTELIQSDDRKERFSLADKNNLSSKEEVILNFNGVKDNTDLGLILNFRQTLMTTYFIYSAIGYMGDNVSDVFAKAENDKGTKDILKKGIRKELGDIEIYQWNAKDKTWDLQDGLFETGPIAINRQLVKLKNFSSGSQVKLKLILNRGLWRLDYAALTNIKKQVKPIELKPVRVFNKGVMDTPSMLTFNHADQFLISMPGSEFKFDFELPEADRTYELFLYSQGYYLEWMRAHWIKDKNLLKLKEMIEHPKIYLKSEAKNYATYELEMEAQFWGSKIDTKTFSYYDK